MAQTEMTDESFKTDESNEEERFPKQKIPSEILEQARELCRGAEVLPEGEHGLAKKIFLRHKEGKVLRVKLGVDPTSTDLHIGHAVVFRKLRRFQEFGHQIVLIIGGFTARIGDPTGRNATRPPLTAEQVNENAQTYIDQMGVVLDMEKTEIRNNADWLASMNLTDVIKLASQVTANQLIAKEAFGSRLEQQLPVSFHELFYPLLQGYDSIAITADVELGGTDQRFNILQGRDLQPHYLQEPQLAMLLPLLEGTDGVKKMSKSYGNYIGLKDEPYDMFGKCMSIQDSQIVKYFELATTLSGKEVDAVKDALSTGGNPRDAKMQLAQQIVRQYHGEQAAVDAVNQWNQVHVQNQAPSEMPSFNLSGATPLFRLMTDSGLAKSNGDAKRLVQNGGVKLDGVQIQDPNHVVSLDPGAKTVLQVGRRQFVEVVHQP